MGGRRGERQQVKWGGGKGEGDGREGEKRRREVR